MLCGLITRVRGWASRTADGRGGRDNNCWAAKGRSRGDHDKFQLQGRGRPQPRRSRQLQTATAGTAEGRGRSRTRGRKITPQNELVLQYQNLGKCFLFFLFFLVNVPRFAA